MWIPQRKGRFASKRKNELMPRAESPFKVLLKINDNAYKVDLLGDYGVSATFIVAYLSPYLADDYFTNLPVKSSQQGENDGIPKDNT